MYAYIFALLDNQTYFDPNAMKDNINFPEVPHQPTYANIRTGKNGHYEMQSSTEVEYDNGSQPGHVYEMGPTTTTEAHEMHYVNIFIVVLQLLVYRMCSQVYCVLFLQAEPHSPAGVEEYYSSIIHKVLIFCSMDACMHLYSTRGDKCLQATMYCK